MNLRFRSDMSVSLLQHMGSDEFICKAARVSTLGVASLETTEAKGLINFLMANRHGTPFEHGAVTFLIDAPIFMWREHIRHRIGFSYNETSARYRELDPVFYRPDSDRPLRQVGKPGAYTFVPGTELQAARVESEIEYACTRAWSAYQQMLKDGVAKEVARMVLPVNIYSAAYVTCNPRSIMSFLSLRTSREGSTFPSYPQREIEMVAEQMESYFAALFPLTHAAFDKNGRVSP